MAEWESMGELMETWAAKIPERRYGPDGNELLSSRMRRAAHAHRLQLEAGALDPALKAANEAERRKRLAEDRVQRSTNLEADFWARMPNALSAMGLEPQEAAALAALEQRPGVKAAETWWRSDKLFLVLGGFPGTGKTTAAASVLPLAAAQRIVCESVEGHVWDTALARFAKAQELARMSLYGDETKKRLAKLKLVGLLVVDDLGAEAKSDAWWALFDELVDARARHQVRTLVTTNLSSAQLRERYGERVLRRLKEFGQFVAVEKTRVNTGQEART